MTNLVGTIFLKGSDNVAKVPASTSLNNRTDGLSFVRVSCTVNGTLVDSRIKQSPFHTQFCLKLPKSSYDKAIDKVTAIDTPVRVIGSTLSLSIFTATSSPSQVINTPTPAPATSIPIASTPKMDRLLNMGHNTAGDIISYFGDMTFLDDQEAFFKTFEDNPAMLPYNANKQGERDVRKKLLEYSAKCMFDVFLCIC